MNDLDSLLDGNVPEPPPPDDGTRLPKPAYRRDGLYGATPFKPGNVCICAVIVEQICILCGCTRDYLQGVYKEFNGRGLHGDITLRNRVDSIALRDVNRIVRQREHVPYCPECLSRQGIMTQDALPYPTPDIATVVPPSREGVGDGLPALTRAGTFDKPNTTPDQVTGTSSEPT